MRNTYTVRPGELLADFAYYKPGATPAGMASWLRAAKYKGVVRYIDGSTHDPSRRASGKPNPKNLTKAEAAAFYAAGLGVTLVFERNVERPLKGTAGGREDGLLAKLDAKALDYPNTEVILAAVDIDATKTNMPLVTQYLSAFRQACSPWPCGVYGDFDVITALEKAEPGKWQVYWQPNAAGWSGYYAVVNFVRKFFRRTHPKAHVLQKSGISTPHGVIDPNEVLRPFAIYRGPAPAIPPFDPSKGQWGLWPLNKNKPRLSIGSRGDAVRYLQGVIALKAGGNIVVDGVFGMQTDMRVRDLQRTFRLVEDGIVGPQTWGVVDFLAVRK
jgi:hypothetical protein